jgi:hypothetical protein
MLTSAIRVITLLAGEWNGHIFYTSHYSLSRSMECPRSALRDITILAGALNAHLCSTSQVCYGRITLLAGAWNAHPFSTSHYSLSRSMKCSPLLYESLFS